MSVADVCRALHGTTLGYIIFSPRISGVICLSILFMALGSFASLPESVDGFSVVCRALYGKVAWVYYIYVLEYSVCLLILFTVLALFASLLESVVDGFIGDHLLRQGSIIDNCYFNGTSFHVTGLLCIFIASRIIHCVRDQQSNLF